MIFSQLDAETLKRYPTAGSFGINLFEASYLGLAGWELTTQLSHKGVLQFFATKRRYTEFLGEVDYISDGEGGTMVVVNSPFTQNMLEVTARLKLRNLMWQVICL